MQKKYFLRANTSSGLVNFTDNNLYGIENVYLLNGKSKFLKDRILKNVEKYTKEREREIECAVSPFDISQFDAIILRNEKTAIVDADCMAKIEKCTPIETDEFISQNKIAKYKARQDELLKKQQDALLGLYSAYKGAKIIHDEWEKRYIENIDFERLNNYEDGLLENLITKKSNELSGRTFKRFFGASTPDGSVNYIDNLTENLKTRYFIKGRPGTGKSTFMKKLQKKAEENGYSCQIYYCSFDKNSLDMVLIPELSMCVFDSTAPHELFPSCDNDKILDFYKEAGLSGIDERLKKEFDDIKRRYAFRITEGVAKLRLANAYLKERESYYRNASNIELADKTADKIIRKIIN